MFRLAACAVLALAALLAPAPSAQTTLKDKTSVVATDLGLFRAEEGKLAQQIAGPALFGGATELVRPSITWIKGTDFFILTLQDGQGTGGLWRVEVKQTGAATVEDITPAPALGIGKDFVDADYSVGLDALFVVEDTTGTIWILGDPAHRHGDDMAAWGSAPPDIVNSIAVNGANQPFSVIAALRTGPILRVTKDGSTQLFDVDVFSQISSNPVTGEWYVMHQGNYSIGKLGQGFVLEMNSYGFCPKLVQKPVDIIWDPVARRVVTIGEKDMSQCGFGGLPVGPNHIVRLPLTAGGGPPSNEPVLLTFPGPSDILGVNADLAFVRLDGSDVTFVGSPGVAGSGVSPVQVAGGYGTALAKGATTGMLLESAPPSASAFLVLGFTVLAQPFQGQLFMPDLHILLPVTTDANGEAPLSVPVPDLDELLGLKVYAQWWIDDTTTGTAGDWVSTRTAIYTIGKK
ncbi:MAG: hypothetical protein ACYTG2_07775 [Planctomycetota bacterium]|jgi:hypothetical protein